MTTRKLLIVMLTLLMAVGTMHAQTTWKPTWKGSKIEDVLVDKGTDHKGVCPLDNYGKILPEQDGKVFYLYNKKAMFGSDIQTVKR